jgi:hypothetical protein
MLKLLAKKKQVFIHLTKLILVHTTIKLLIQMLIALIHQKIISLKQKIILHILMALHLIMQSVALLPQLIKAHKLTISNIHSKLHKKIKNIILSLVPKVMAYMKLIILQTIKETHILMKQLMKMV